MRRTNSKLVKAAFATTLGILSVPSRRVHRGASTGGPALPAIQPISAAARLRPAYRSPARFAVGAIKGSREVQTIFGRYFAEWQALTPMPTYAVNPPILIPNGYQAQRILGGLLNFDESISPFQNIACASCHMPYAAFSGPIPSVNLTMVAYPGSFRYRAAKRTAQRYTYSQTFPVLSYNKTQQLFFGGNFWDGRATGMKLQSSRRRTGTGPSGRSVGNGLRRHGLHRVSDISAPYRQLFELVWGVDFDIRFPANTARSAPSQMGRRFGGSATPIGLSPTDRTKATNIYDHWGQSLSFLERSVDVSPFNSKFDAFLAGNYLTLTADEMAGYKLFKGKGNCNSCHLDGDPPPDAGPDRHRQHRQVEPLFTCFGYANVGLPLNPRLPLFYESTPDPFRVYAQSRRFAATEIWGLALSSGAARKPFPIPTSRIGYRLRRRWTAKPGDDGARCGADTAAVPDHRGRPGGSERADSVLPEGVLPQWLHQEPEATGALL